MSTIKVDGIRSNSATSDAITLASDGTCTANITNRSNRNLIINGGMKVAQRGTVTQLLYNYAGPDRFRLTGDGSQRSTISSDSITVDSKGQSNAYKLDVTTANASPSASNYQLISYRFEGQDLQHLEKGTSNAKAVTLQFWVKSPKTGVHIVELQDQSNSSRHINKSYTISSANTWQKVVITFEGDTTGAITNDNTRKFDLNFWLMAGSTWTSGSLQTSWGSNTYANRAVGQVNVIDSTSNDFYLTGVQLEVGSVATDFEHRSFGQELALCQRYYELIVERDEGSNAKENCIGLFWGDGSNSMTWIKFHVKKRTQPTLDVSNFTNAFRFYGTGGGVNASTMGTNTLHRDGMLLEQSGNAGSNGFTRTFADGSDGLKAIVAASAEL